MARVHARRDRALEADPVLGGAAPHRDELVDLVVGLGVQRLALVEGERAGELVAAALADVGDAAQRGGARERGLALPGGNAALAAAIARRASSRSPWATGPSCLAGRRAGRFGHVAGERVLPCAGDEHAGGSARAGGHSANPMHCSRVGDYG